MTPNTNKNTLVLLVAGLIAGLFMVTGSPALADSHRDVDSCLTASSMGGWDDTRGIVLDQVYDLDEANSRQESLSMDVGGDIRVYGYSGEYVLVQCAELMSEEDAKAQARMLESDYSYLGLSIQIITKKG